MPTEKIVEHITWNSVVPCSAEQAFNFFVTNLNAWWPAEYTWSGDALQEIAIELRINGHCYEEGPYGFRCDWGRVIKVEPPHSIRFTWQISPERVPEPNPEKASEIEVTFTKKSNSSSEINFEHRFLERHGNMAGEYYNAMRSPQGWPYILGCYLKALNNTYGVPGR